jgi:membrane protease YdiL (CAAX protease family)
MVSTVLAELATLAGMAALFWIVVEERSAGRAPLVSLGARWFGRARTSSATVLVAAAAGVSMVALPLLPALVAGAPARTDRSAVTAGAVALTVALKLLLVVFEEVTYRGALLDQLRARIGTAQAIVASALLFGLAHATRPGDPDHAAVVLVTAVDAVGYGAAAALTASLWTPVAWHLSKNLAVWQLTGVSSIQFAPGAFAFGDPAAPATTGDAGWAAVVVALALPLVWALARDTTRNP